MSTPETGLVSGAGTIMCPFFQESAELESAAGPFGELLARYRLQPAMGKRGTLTWLYGERGKPDALLLGLGEAASFSRERLREAAGEAARAAQETRKDNVALTFGALLPFAATRATELTSERLAADWTEGWVLGGDQSYSHKAAAIPTSDPVVFLDDNGTADEGAAAIAAGRLRAEGTLLARQLAGEPPDVIYPSALAERVQARFADVPVEVKVYSGEQLIELGMTGLIAVGRGSRRPPVFLELRYCTDPSLPLIALIGKGITFDTGGISLKRDNNISDMRMDMAGAGAVIGALDRIARSGAEANVAVLVPAAENMIGPDALLPGEILTYANGLTVQVGNTDAEGRLVLADALLYAKQIGAQQAIDIATLTYSVVGALGSRIAGIWGGDSLVRELCAAGERVGEKLWPMPLVDEYESYLDSACADSSNISSAGEAGAIVAALFLRKFVDPSMSWAHIDMAGLKEAAAAKGYIVPGATGFGARLLAEYVMTAHRTHK
ncbi:leucyl aminopeptidase family protein [Paenibacillaceae bacterium]|nr:leucyl aminopeptidase family protein [Paenibacillaceae bacterium]